VRWRGALLAEGLEVGRERGHVRTSGGSISIVGNGIAYNVGRVYYGQNKTDEL